MKLLSKITLFASLASTSVSLFSSAAQAAPLPRPKWSDLVVPSRIRVRLAEAAPLVRIRGFDLRIYESRKDRAGVAQRSLASAPERISEWELRCRRGRIRAVPVRGGAPLDLQEPVEIRSPTGFLKYRDRPYREEIEIYSAGSQCEVVNHLDVERYLDGLVNSEFNSRWSEEAIGAQVIAARTYALHQMMIARSDPDRHYDVDSTTRDQVYDGSMKEDYRASRSVERTRGMVLTTGSAARPAPLKAFYHSTCGGMTELPQHVWGGTYPGFKRAVRCPYCAGSPAYNWKLELQAEEIIRAFGQAAASAAPAFARTWPAGWREAIRGGKLLEVRAGRWDPEGRVSEIISIWSLGGRRLELRVSGAQFRDWIGPARFRSASFQVIAHHEAPGGAVKWQFQGRGNGHGVGMCQWGAKTMGERGFATAAILKHYYPDAVLRKLW